MQGKSKATPLVYVGVAVMLILLAMSAFEFSREGAEEMEQLVGVRRLYTTNSVRSSLVGKYCSAEISNVTQSERSTNQMYNSSLATYFKANATKLITGLIAMDLSGIFTQIQINGIGTIAFIAPFIIGLVLLLAMWPCLVCCCICQDDCPPRCCRERNTLYSTFEINWPTVALLLMAVLSIVAAIPAMTNSKKFFGEFSCQTSKMLDNFQNGNTTASGLNFFSGISTINGQLGSILSPALSAVQSQVTKLKDSAGNEMNTAKSKGNTALNGMKTMPNGVDNGPFVQTYSYPLESSAASGTLTSVLAAKIGTYGVSTTALGSLYSYLSELVNNLTTITNAAGNVEAHVTTADMGSHISNATSILGQVQTNLDTMRSQLSNVLDLLGKIDGYNTQYSMVIYGTTLGLGFLVIVGVIFVKCFGKIGCRHFLYLICLITFFLTAVAFIFAIILSLLMPSLYYTCSYLQPAFTSPIAFASTLKTLGGGSFIDISNSFSQCYGGTNDFLTYVEPTLSTYMADLKTTFFNSKLYDITATMTGLDTRLNAIKTLIDDYGKGKLPDFDITTANGLSEIVFFNNLANKTYLELSCPQSSFSDLYTDVYVPGISTSYQQLVDCIGKVPVDATTCTSGLVNPPCPTSRCIDTFSLLSYYYRAGTTASITGDSTSRYSGACTPLNSFLNNFETNYVGPINLNIGNTAQDSAVNTKLAGRYNSKAKVYIDDLKTYLSGTIQPLFSQAYGNLSSLESIFEPTTGMITGLDCRLLQEDAENMRESLCISTFNRIFFTLVLIGILAFSLFFMMCCTLCFAVRHYQHSRQGKLKIVPIPLDETSSSVKMG